MGTGRATGDVYFQNEVEQSTYNFELANVELLAAVRPTSKRRPGACSKPDWRCPATRW
jgi:glycyl-tRNA synthetase alpha subunit